MKPRIIEASGSHYTIGWKIGKHCADMIRSDISEAYPDPKKVSPDYVARYLATTWKTIQQDHPELAEEYRGLADGASVSLRDLIASVAEELLDLDASARKGCTDIIAAPPATAPGVLGLLGHNNDSIPEYQQKIVVLYLAPEDGPESLSVGFSGTSPMVGLNSNGLAVGGNQLIQKDAKIGIPRIVLIRATLDCSGISAAEKIITDPDRASSYNVTLLDAMGHSVDLEGSGTNVGTFGPGLDGIIWHSNHYVHSKMQQYEAKPRENMPYSVIRFERAKELLTSNLGKIDFEVVKGIMRDHVGQPIVSICRHNEFPTVFSTIIDPSNRTLWLTIGNPCKSEYVPYRL